MYLINKQKYQLGL